MQMAKGLEENNNKNYYKAVLSLGKTGSSAGWLLESSSVQVDDGGWKSFVIFIST